MTDYKIANERNYAAESVYIDPELIIEYESLQNLMGFPWAGYVALIPREYIGFNMVIFPAESQLSDELAKVSNLYSKSDKNDDTTVKGYLPNNRRVRAIKLRGVHSSAIVLPSTQFGNPPLGTVFDTVDGVEVCRKYVPPSKNSGGNGGTNNVEKLWRRVDDKFLPMHYDTGQWWREWEKFSPDDHVVVTQKLDGTSVRIGNTYVKRQHNWLERLAIRLGVPVKQFEFDYIGGSRKVIKDPNNPAQQHYYGEDHDIWTDTAVKYGPMIPSGVIVYGELIGYVEGTSTPIQPGYTYDLEPGGMDLYVYRVAVVQEDGGLYDLSWGGVKEFCRDRGLKWVPELWNGEARNFDPEEWTDKTFYKDSRYDSFPDKPVPTCAQSPCDEGVVIRREGVIPFALKAKGKLYYEFETKLLDDGAESPE